MYPQVPKDKWSPVGIVNFRVKLLFIAVFLTMVGLGLFAAGFITWDSILTPALGRSSTNEDDISALEDEVDTLTTTVTNNYNTLSNEIAALNNTVIVNENLIISKMRLSANAINVSSSVNFPFNFATYDAYNLYDNTTKQWVTNMNGYWELVTCIVWSFSTMPGFPATDEYDLQLQVFVDGAFNSFMSVFHGPANTSLTQQTVCGTDTFNLTTGQNVTMRVQARIFPATLVESDISGGIFAPTRAIFQYLGT